ncbi:MAG TPA: glycosyltransferase family 4 protein [Candidatus Acidoferrales bacterium]|nr:glycosyltransferase family 4 protein [Candidatus Acidoferrales bacterium]
MRILIAIGVPRQAEAGAASVAINHAREFEKNGHRVDCWFLEDVLSQPARPKRFEALIFAVKLAKRIARSRRSYDVVNLHAPWGCAYGILSTFQPAQRMPPYVFTMQGSEDWYVKMMREEWRKGRASNFSWRNRAWHRAYHHSMYGWSIRTAAFGAIANTEARDTAERKYKMPPGRLVYVPNGVEDCFFISRDYEPGTATRLLFVGSWLDRKGIFYLVDAFTSLARKMSGVVLTVAGCLLPEPQVSSYFPEDVRNRVRILPLVKRCQMPQLYADHDVFVFPSLVEGMPLSLLEAIATGMPIVTTDAPGMNDLIRNNFNGLLVPPADAARLEEAIAVICRNSDLRQRLGKEAQRTARECTWAGVAASLEKIFVLATERAHANY